MLCMLGCMVNIELVLVLWLVGRFCVEVVM